MKLNNRTIKRLFIFLIIALATTLITVESYSKPVAKPYLGIMVKDISTALEKHLNLDYGVIVTWIDEDSPADEAGFKRDDIILDINGERIDSPNELRRIVQKFNPDDKVKIIFLREGNKIDVSVKLAESPENKWQWDKQFDFRDLRFGERAYLGITMQALDTDLSDYFGVKPGDGVLIIAVEKDSPAEKAGLKSGDVVIKINDKKISEPEGVREIISDFKDGEEITVEFYRHKKTQTVKLVLEVKESKYKLFLRQLPERMDEMRLKIEREIDDEELDKIDRELKKMDDQRIFIDRESNIIKI